MPIDRLQDFYIEEIQFLFSSDNVTAVFELHIRYCQVQSRHPSVVSRCIVMHFRVCTLYVNPNFRVHNK